MKSFSVFLSVIALVTAGVHAQAQPYIVSNLDLANTNQTTVSNNAWGATSFTTDAFPYQLESVTARFLGSRTPLDSDYMVRLFSDNGGVPGTSLVSLITPNPTVVSGSFREIVWTPSLTQMLAPSTSYWFVFGGVTGGAIHTTNSPAQTGSWTIGNFISFSSNETAWSSTANGISFQFGVNATVVSASAPEPSTLALISFAALGFIARRRKNH